MHDARCSEGQQGGTSIPDQFLQWSERGEMQESRNHQVVAPTPKLLNAPREPEVVVDGKDFVGA